jgi:hypothetical protein
MESGKVVSSATKQVTPRVIVLFNTFKYLTYLVLLLDCLHFSREEIGAARFIFRDGVALDELIQAYPATIDGWAWMILLLIFELETAVLPAERIRGALAWALHVVRGACYLFGFYAFYGYLSTLLLVFTFAPYAGQDVCALAGGGFSLMGDLLTYAPLDAANCSAPRGVEWHRLPGHEILATSQALPQILRLAWTDVINATAWLGVVIVLEADVWLQRKERLVGNVARASMLCKAILYSTLIGTAIHWGIEGSFIDLRDAVLWLVAFAFIELNLLGLDSLEEADADALA